MMGMNRRLARQVLMMLMVLTILLPMVPVPGLNQVAEVQADTEPTINIGDYFSFGSYNNAPIL